MIDARVKKFNTDEWRRKYMTFEYMLKERERIGIEQGRAEGAAQKQREIAKNMRKEGIAKEVIEKITGLPCRRDRKIIGARYRTAGADDRACCVSSFIMSMCAGRASRYPPDDG